ncbi:glycosyltransferase family 2 protein [Daejeonella oryzae]|uniref:glycosyltransferase family 2 protein n=1 Tax=Daejeonella oryzae TaxID=1122943 RepID=UPI00040B5F2D|nr:glycosyltransferase family 2 protein [Daejeonella oryzae]
MNKKVSVIIPTYNGEVYIQDCLNSVLNQTYKNIEVIVVDDDSKDNTREIIQANYLNFVKFVSNKVNLGLIKSVNNCFSHCTGDFVIVLGQDDMMINDRIEKQVHFMEQNPDALGSFGNSYYIINNEKTNRKIINKETLKSFLFNSFNNSFFLYCCRVWYNSNSAIFKLDAVVKAGGYSEHMRNFGESFLFFKLGLMGPVRYQNEVLSYYRIHETNIFGSKSKAEKKQTSEKIFSLFFEKEEFKYKPLYKFINAIFSTLK